MPVEIVRNDITHMHVDAIVNAANSSLLGGGGVDGAIHRAAGPMLLEECRLLGGCETGRAKITKGYNLPARYVIHTVGPVWQGGGKGERELLVSCYEQALQLAKENGCESIAFPLISAGAYGYPPDQALQTALHAVSGFLMDNEMKVYIVVFDRQSMLISTKLFKTIVQYIDDRYAAYYAESRTMQSARRMQTEAYAMPAPAGKQDDKLKKKQSSRSGAARLLLAAIRPSRRTKTVPEEEYGAFRTEPEAGLAEAEYVEEMAAAPPQLEEMLMQLDESFSQMLLRKIDECGMTDVECYKRANISRKLFSKIRSDIHYKPGKRTAVAFAIALKLPLHETKELLEKAGFALTHSSRFDVIVEYFVLQGNYNIFEINEALFAFDQPTLGG